MRSFEAILKCSRVYRHVYIWGDGSSLGSSVMKRTRWMTMSDYSLSEVSNIAVIDLPLWSMDLWNVRPYIDINIILEGDEMTDKATTSPVSIEDLGQFLHAIVEGDVDLVR